MHRRQNCRMARADLLVHLVRAARTGDDLELRRSVDALIAEERSKDHHLLAERLQEALRSNGSADRNGAIVPNGSLKGVDLIRPTVRLDDLFLEPQTREAVGELIEEQKRIEVLRAHGLEPRHRLLLTGPPGNGKTSLARATAEALLVPLLVIRYHEVIGSYLGETAARLAQVFEAARTRQCVLFFDEFDALAKERGDEHETGEIKRVVTTLLLQIDEVPSHVVVIAASNHPELLDRAVDRRFQIRLRLGPPGIEERKAWFGYLLDELGERVGMTPQTFAKRSAGASYSRLNDFTEDLRRRRVLEPGTPLRRLISSRLTRWQHLTAAHRSD